VPVHQTKSKGKVIKMKVRKKNALRSSAVIQMALAIALVCGVPASFVAQELVKGTFTLSEPVRFGSTVLPAGPYTMSVEPVTSTKVLVFVRAENKIGPVASLLATASQRGCEVSSRGLSLQSDGTGLVARSMCLHRQELTIDFDLAR
jgi:hypothetical protein